MKTGWRASLVFLSRGVLAQITDLLYHISVTLSIVKTYNRTNNNFIFFDFF